MRKKTQEHYAKLAQKSAEKQEMRRRFRLFLERHELERSEQNAHSFAFSLSLNSNDRVNLVYDLMSEIQFNAQKN